MYVERHCVAKRLLVLVTLHEWFREAIEAEQLHSSQAEEIAMFLMPRGI